MKRFVYVVLAGFLAACVVQTDTVEGKKGDPGSSPFVQVGDDALYNPGDVGIGTGTAAPASRLHVVGAEAFPGPMGSSVSTDAVEPTKLNGKNTHFTADLIGSEIVVNDEGRIVTGVMGDHTLIIGAPFTNAANDSNFAIREPVARFVLDDGKTAAMIVNSQGAVGIGTPSPSEGVLDVAGAIRTRGAGGTCRLVLTSTAPGGQQYEWYNDSDGVGNLALYNRTTNNTLISFAPTGNVGIGTTTPKHLLSVSGAVPGGPVTASIENVAADGGGSNLVIAGGYPGSAALVMKSGSDISWSVVANDGGHLSFSRAGQVQDAFVLYGNGSAVLAGDLYVQGYVIPSNGPGNNCPCTQFSDARLKRNIAPLPSALTHLLRLRGVTYEWQDPSKHANVTGTQIGMIAQEVEQVFPSWVGTDAEGYKTLIYRGFEALTVESFRELDARATKLADENRALTTKLASLEERLAAVEKRGGVQHASFMGGGPWPFVVLLGLALGAAPLWLRRRRTTAAPP